MKNKGAMGNEMEGNNSGSFGNNFLYVTLESTDSGARWLDLKSQFHHLRTM